MRATISRDPRAIGGRLCGLRFAAMRVMRWFTRGGANMDRATRNDCWLVIKKSVT